MGGAWNPRGNSVTTVLACIGVDPAGDMDGLDGSASPGGAMETGLLAVPDALDAAPATRLLKFEVQMYKLRDGEYLVDFQVG
jgi:hypothetical protein